MNKKIEEIDYSKLQDELKKEKKEKELKMQKNHIPIKPPYKNWISEYANMHSLLE